MEKLKPLVGAIIMLLFSLYFGEQALIDFKSGGDPFRMIVSLLLTLGCLIVMGNFIKQLSS